MGRSKQDSKTPPPPGQTTCSRCLTLILNTHTLTHMWGMQLGCRASFGTFAGRKPKPPSLIRSLKIHFGSADLQRRFISSIVSSSKVKLHVTLDVDDSTLDSELRPCMSAWRWRAGICTPWTLRARGPCSPLARPVRRRLDPFGNATGRRKILEG